MQTQLHADSSDTADNEGSSEAQEGRSDLAVCSHNMENRIALKMQGISSEWLKRNRRKQRTPKWSLWHTHTHTHRWPEATWLSFSSSSPAQCTKDPTTTGGDADMGLQRCASENQLFDWRTFIGWHPSFYFPLGGFSWLGSAHSTHFFPFNCHFCF